MAYSYEPTALPAMMKVQDAPRSPTSVVDGGYPAPSMMLKDMPIQRDAVHDPADMVARHIRRIFVWWSASLLVIVFAVLSVTKLLDLPATPNDEASTLSVSKLNA